MRCSKVQNLNLLGNPRTVKKRCRTLPSRYWVYGFKFTTQFFHLGGCLRMNFAAPVPFCCSQALKLNQVFQPWDFKFLRENLKVVSLSPSDLQVSFSRRLKTKHMYKNLLFTFLTCSFQLNYYYSVKHMLFMLP